MKILKTDPKRFENLPDYPYKAHFIEFEGMQMHYLDEGDGEVILALHGEPTWSFLYRKFIPKLPNYRFIAPDLIGFGKSDKIQGWKNYNYELHFRSLENFITKLDLNDITVIVQDWGGLLGLPLLAEHADRFKRVVVLNTAIPIGKPLPMPFKLWQIFSKFHPSLPVGSIVQKFTYDRLSQEVVDGYKAPFPSAKYKAGAKAFPQLVPGRPDAQGVDRLKKARKVLSEWGKPALVLFSDKDPVMSGLANFFRELIPTADSDNPITIKNASHFLQEDKGEEIAIHIDEFIKAN